MRKLVVGLMLMVGLAAHAYEYDVSEPKIRPQCKGAEPGVWTLDKDAALAAAKAEDKYTLLLFTGSWWCPYCHTIEDLVLTSKKWKDYVREKGFYLAEQDYSYRYAVPEGQEWKSYYPDATEGWGFKCWYMNPEFLSDNGLTTEDGLKAIQDAYVYQGQMALPDATLYTMKTWDGASEITYGRIAYACIVVIGPDGEELGRVDFPWYSKASVTASEAQEFEIQSIERILNGTCALCSAPTSGTPDVSSAQIYRGWITDAAGGVAGTAEFKTKKVRRNGTTRVSGSMTVNGRKTRFGTVVVDSFDKTIEFRKGGTSAAVHFGRDGFVGTATGDFGTCAISGGRDVFKAKDAASVARRTARPVGYWNVVLKSADPEVSPFAGGYGTLSVGFGANGRATVKGALGDGTKVNVKSQVIIGEDGMSCVPVRADLYGKKGGIGFVLWFKDGKLFSVTDEAKWVAAGRNGSFETAVGVSFTTSPGPGKTDSELDFMLDGFDEDVKIKGMPVVVDPTLDVVEIAGDRWVGSTVTYFRATANAGVLKGSMKFQVVDGKRIRKVKGTFVGVVMGGSGYGTVYVKGVGSWAVKLVACGSCVAG